MNFEKYLGIALMLLITITSCKRSVEEIEQEYLTTSISAAKVGENVEWVVILPGLGCHGCIMEGEVFMRDHIKNRNILFVLTKISSLKILQQKTGVKVAQQPNVYVDKEEMFNIPTDNSIYPCIIKMSKKSMVSYEFQSPKNSSAFAKLHRLALVQ